MTKITEGQLKELVDAASIVERETMRMRQILTTGAVPPGWRPAVRQLENLHAGTRSRPKDRMGRATQGLAGPAGRSLWISGD